jgi:very-short-patch-repair endonuclease
VQGDERDIIFISIGYGKTRDKKLSMNFGPLNKDGGERRLNVLISRARLRCEVFTNLKADDIDLNRTNAIGIKAFKSFLRYSETGDLDLAKGSGREPDSPFERSVAESLERLGYKVEYQVGMAGFFIDLAIVDDQKPGAYVVGIECDGATYHRSASARDRDRLRQGILESKGWKILRVWSTDWFNNPVRELQRLRMGIEHAKNSTPKPTIPHNQPTLSIVRQETKLQPEVGPSTSSAYRLAQVTSAYFPVNITEVSKSELLRLIDEVVQVESPIHTDELIQRVSRALHFERASKTIRAAIVDAISYLSTVRIYGDFIYSAKQKTFVMRDRSGLATESRQSRFIAPEEIREGVLIIIQTSLGDVTLVDLVKEVRTGLGFTRTTKEIEQAIVTEIHWLVEAKKLQEKQLGIFRLL